MFLQEILQTYREAKAYALFFAYRQKTALSLQNLSSSGIAFGSIGFFGFSRSAFSAEFYFFAKIYLTFFMGKKQGRFSKINAFDYGKVLL